MNEHVYLAHHGIKGMKWGVRRFRNPDGSLTEAGRKRYGVNGKAKFSNWRKVDAVGSKYGTDVNRQAVANSASKRIETDERLSSIRKEHAQLASQMNAEFANTYNKYVSASKRVNPKTFRYANQWEELDDDADSMAWDNLSDNFRKLAREEQRVRSSYDEERKKIVDSYVQQFSDASLSDIPHDGSPRAKNHIEKYASYAIEGWVHEDHGTWVSDPFDI